MGRENNEVLVEGFTVKLYGKPDESYTESSETSEASETEGNPTGSGSVEIMDQETMFSKVQSLDFHSDLQEECDNILAAARENLPEGWEYRIEIDPILSATP